MAACVYGCVCVQVCVLCGLLVVRAVIEGMDVVMKGEWMHRPVLNMYCIVLTRRSRVDIELQSTV